MNGAGVAFTIGSTLVTWQTIGFILFAAVVLVALWQLLRRDDAEGLLLGALVLAVAFFVLPTASTSATCPPWRWPRR